MAEFAPAVVDAVEAHLLSAVADLDARQGHVVLVVSDLADEGLDAVILPFDDHLSEENAFPGHFAEVANPEFNGGLCRRVEHEFSGVDVIGGGCLDASDVGAVAELGHAVAAHFLGRAAFQEQVSVLLRAESLDGLAVEAEVNAWG